MKLSPVKNTQFCGTPPPQVDRKSNLIEIADDLQFIDQRTVSWAKQKLAGTGLIVDPNYEPVYMSDNNSWVFQATGNAASAKKAEKLAGVDVFSNTNIQPY